MSESLKIFQFWVITRQRHSEKILSANKTQGDTGAAMYFSPSAVYVSHFKEFQEETKQTEEMPLKLMLSCVTVISGR